MTKIDDEIIKALIQPEQYGKIGKDAPIKKIIRYGNIDFKPEVDIGKNRTVDLLVTILSSDQKVIIEVENDRKFDAGEILRKIKRDTHWPIFVIIPKVEKRSTWLFQTSEFFVWYWTAKCKWICRDNECNKITTSTSSLTPIRCTHCHKGGSFLSWVGADVEFDEAENNPSKSYDELTRKPGFFFGP